MPIENAQRRLVHGLPPLRNSNRRASIVMTMICCPGISIRTRESWRYVQYGMDMAGATCTYQWHSTNNLVYSYSSTCSLAAHYFELAVATNYLVHILPSITSHVKESLPKPEERVFLVGAGYTNGSMYGINDSVAIPNG